MVFCPECGTKNEDDALFCENCGFKLDPITEEVSETIEEVTEDVMVEASEEVAETTEEVVEVAEEITAPVEEVIEEPVMTTKDPDEEPKDNSIKKILMFGGLGIVAVVALVFVASLLFGSKDPTYMLVGGILDNMTNDDVTATTEITFLDVPRDFDFLTDAKIKFEYGQKDLRIGAKVDVTYEKDSLFEAAIVADDDNMFIDFMENYDDVLFMEIDDFEEAMEAIVQGQKYLANFKVKGVDWKAYAELFTEEMDGSIEKDGSDVVLTMDLKDILSALEEVLEMAEDDDDLRDGLRLALIDLFETMIEDDFELDGADSDEWEEALDFLEDEDDWEDAYDDFFDSSSMMFGGLGYYMYELEAIDDMEIRYSFSGSKLTGVEFIIDDGGFEVEIITSLKGKYSGESYDDKDAEDIEDMDYDDVMEIYEEVAEEVAEKISDNDDLMDAIEDSPVYEDYEDYYGGDVEDFIEEMIFDILYDLY